jgi:hypothetical protein
MSGGSFNYVCFAESYNIFEKRNNIADMRDKLIEFGYKDAARETESLLLLMDSFETRVDAHLERLKEVWHSVEWCCSGDEDMIGVENSIKKYREG